MGKFKVGDKVRIRKGLKPDAMVDGMYCNDIMASYGGQHDTIKSVVQDRFYTLEQHYFVWNDAVLEPAEAPKKHLERLVIVSNGDKTTAIHYLPDGSKREGYAKRNPKDENDFNVAVILAAARAGVLLVDTDKVDGACKEFEKFVSAIATITSAFSRGCE